MTEPRPLALTLVAAPAARDHLGGVVLDLEEALPGTAVRWLSPGEAADLLVEARREDLEKRADLAVGSAPIDFAVQPQAGRLKRILVADMESTLIEQEMVDELAARVGLRAEIAEITERSMTGELDFEESLRARVAKLEGIPEETLEELAEIMTFTPGARQLFATMNAQGAVTAIVTGGFTYFAEIVREALKAEELFANHLLIEDGVVSGKVGDPVLGRAGKLESLKALAERTRLPLSAAAAVGDGANDLQMLDAAGLGVAFRGKPAVRQAARFRVDHTGLDSLLFYQGLARAEFALAE